MEIQEIQQYIQKFITVTLDDGSKVSGYISNVEELRNYSAQTLELVNGLQASSVQISRILDIVEAIREDTLEIPIVTDTDILKKADKPFNDKLDELFSKSMDDVLEVKLPNGKVIDNTPFQKKK